MPEHERCPKCGGPQFQALAHTKEGCKPILYCAACSAKGGLESRLYNLVKALGHANPLELKKTCKELQDADEEMKRRHDQRTECGHEIERLKSRIRDLEAQDKRDWKIIDFDAMRELLASPGEESLTLWNAPTYFPGRLKSELEHAAAVLADRQRMVAAKFKAGNPSFRHPG